MHFLQKHFRFVLLLFFVLYTAFWLQYFHVTFLNKPQTTSATLHDTQARDTNSADLQKQDLSQSVVLGTQTDDQSSILNSEETVVPLEHSIAFVDRKQSFNLSCEFAAASAIIYHYTGTQDFKKENEEHAEKILMKQVGVSQNPNIGIRMSSSVADAQKNLYSNLGQKFGGADYYGIHAPPFIDLFGVYGLLAYPIQKEKSPDAIQKALYKGHVVMAWMQVITKDVIDITVSYEDTIPVVQGEHAVVVTGYDLSGFFIMDPARGQKRHISYSDFQNAISPFVMPLLEVYKAPSGSTVIGGYEPTFGKDYATGLDRRNISFIVQNGTGKEGKASEFAAILQDFGYKVIDIQKTEEQNFNNIRISLSQDLVDYERLLKRDLELTTYEFTVALTNMSASSSANAIAVIGSD